MNAVIDVIQFGFMLVFVLLGWLALTSASARPGAFLGLVLLVMFVPSTLSLGVHAWQWTASLAGFSGGAAWTPAAINWVQEPVKALTQMSGFFVLGLSFGYSLFAGLGGLAELVGRLYYR